MTVGVLALQGGFRPHREALEHLGQDVIEVRTPTQLEAVGALVIPGGESTTISKLIRTSELDEALRKRFENDDLAVFGTCAGMIVSATDIVDGTPDQIRFGVFDATVRRNGIGNQRQSREAPIEVEGLGEDFTAVLIRPPVVEAVGEGVEVLARYHERPILCRQGRHLFASFHPELTGDDRIHQLFLKGL